MTTLKSNFKTYYQEGQTGWFEVNVGHCVNKTCYMNNHFAELRLQTRTVQIDEVKDISGDSKKNSFQEVQVHKFSSFKEISLELYN